MKSDTVNRLPTCNEFKLKIDFKAFYSQNMVAINILMSTLVHNKFSIYNLSGNFNLESELSPILDLNFEINTCTNVFLFYIWNCLILTYYSVVANSYLYIVFPSINERYNNVVVQFIDFFQITMVNTKYVEHVNCMLYVHGQWIYIVF